MAEVVELSVRKAREVAGTDTKPCEDFARNRGRRDLHVWATETAKENPAPSGRAFSKVGGKIGIEINSSRFAVLGLSVPSDVEELSFKIDIPPAQAQRFHFAGAAVG